MCRSRGFGCHVGDWRAGLTPDFTASKANSLGLATYMKLLSHYTRGMTQADRLLDRRSAWSVDTDDS